MEKIKIGLIGLGPRGKYLFYELASCPETQAVVACDLKEECIDSAKEYFKENSVILVPYYTGSGNVSYDVESVYSDGEICRLNIAKHTSGQGGTSVITSYLKAVGIEKNFLDDCSSFDAVLVGYQIKIKE